MDNPTPPGQWLGVTVTFLGQEKRKSFLTFTLVFTENTCPMVARLFCCGSPWTMTVRYQQAGAVVSNACLTGPFINHVKTAHNTDQNEKSAFAGQTAKWVYAERLSGDSAMLQTWWDGIKRNSTAVSSEPRGKNHFHRKGGLEMQFLRLFIQLNCLTRSHIGLAAFSVFSSLCLSRHFF